MHIFPPEDFAVIHCRGRCGKFYTIPLGALHQTAKERGFENLTDFRNAYVCSACEAKFVVMIENISCPNPAREP